MFATTRLLVSQEKITDWRGTLFAEVRLPRFSLRALFSRAREGARVARPDGTVLFQLEYPRGGTFTSLWVADANGDPVGQVEGGRGRYRLLGPGQDVIGDAQVGDREGTIRAGDHTGQAIGAADRKLGAWSVELREGIPDDLCALVLAVVIATDIVSHQTAELDV